MTQRTHHNITVNPDDPTPGEEVQLVGPDGLEDGRTTNVREVISSWLDLYEVRDDRGQIIIITRDGSEWMQILEA